MVQRFLIFWLAGSGWLAAQSIDEVVIPRRTDIFIELQRAINTRVAATGDKFYGQVSVPVTANDQIVIPVGSYIIGHVEASQQPGRLKGKAELLLKFDTLILPDGTTRQMRAVVDSAEDYETDYEGEEGRLRAPGSQGSETAAGAAGGAVTGAIIGTTVGAARGRTKKGLATGTVIGAAGGALLGVFQRGKDVVLPRGSTLTIQLEEDIGFVKPPPPPERVPLG